MPTRASFHLPKFASIINPTWFYTRLDIKLLARRAFLELVPEEAIMSPRTEDP